MRIPTLVFGVLAAVAQNAYADFGKAGTTAIDGRSDMRLASFKSGELDTSELRLGVGAGYFVADGLQR